MNKPKMTTHRVTMPDDMALEYLDKLLVVVNKQFLDPGFPIALSMAIDKMRAPLPDNKVLTVEELREMVGAWVWVIVQYENGKCNGWALVATPAYIGFLEQTIPIDFCGRKFVAYRRPPEKGE